MIELYVSNLQAVGEDMGLKLGTLCCHLSRFSLPMAVPLNLIEISCSPARARFRSALFMTLAGKLLLKPQAANF